VTLLQGESKAQGKVYHYKLVPTAPDTPPRREQSSSSLSLGAPCVELTWAGLRAELFKDLDDRR
jgi:hypothetical protein